MPCTGPAVDVARSTATFNSGAASVVAGGNASLTILLRDASGAPTSAYLPSLLNIAVFGHPSSPLFMNAWTVGVVQALGSVRYPCSWAVWHCNRSAISQWQCNLL